jgi:hypothetical protein
MLHVDLNPVKQYTGPGLDPPVANPQFNIQFQVTDDPVHASIHNDCGTSNELNPTTGGEPGPTSNAYACAFYQAGTLFILSLYQLWL